MRRGGCFFWIVLIAIVLFIGMTPVKVAPLGLFEIQWRGFLSISAIQQNGATYISPIIQWPFGDWKDQ